MHSNACIMLRKNVAAMPMCMGAVRVYTQENLLFTYLLINSIHYEKESIFFDDDAFARLCGRGESGDCSDW